MSFTACWLPVSLPDVTFLAHVLHSGDAVQYPGLAGTHVTTICNALCSASARARAITVNERIEAIDRAVKRLVDPDGEFFPVACRLIPAATGYSPEMARLVIQRMAEDWSQQALESLVQAEFRDPLMLDEPRPDPRTGRLTQALGPNLAAHIFSGNVPGVAVTSLVRALLVKAASFGKTAATEPILPVLFARALDQVNPALASTMAVTYWPHASGDLEAALFAAADAVIVYGGDEVAAAARKKVGWETRLVVHGPRLSLGLVGTVDPSDGFKKIAADAAQAVSLFDQQGCVSPHVIYVLGTIDRAAEFAHALALALEKVARDLPRGSLTIEEASAIRDARTHAEFRAIRGEPVVLHADPALNFTVVLDSDPALTASCLNRFVFVKPIPNLDVLTGWLEPQARHLQSVAVAGFEPEELPALATRLGAVGVSRIASFRSLPWPPPTWHHDGNPPLGELIRWIDVDL